MRFKNLELERHLEEFCAHFGEKKPENLYEVFFREWEKQILEFALTKSQGRQTQAAQLLGINRNTLRKKLLEYQLLWKSKLL